MGKMNDLINQLVDDMDLDVLVVWAEILDVHASPPPLASMWPRWDSELRSEVAEAMEKVGAKK